MLIIIIVLLIIILAFIVLVNVENKFVVSLTRKFIFPIKKDSRTKKTIKKNIIVQVDEEYPSENKDNKYDLYLPKKPLKNKPTIIWVHGGGYVGGDKIDVESFAMKLAQKGYTIIAMNYELAPNALYPTPVKQLGELLKHLEKSKLTNINLHNLFLAGDSVGAHIVMQFMISQIDSKYRKKLKNKKVINYQQVKGLLLYCGAYDIVSYQEKAKLKPTKLIFWQVGWSYFNDKNWSKSELARETIIKNYVSNQLPPAYITDGNTLSFEDQAKELIIALKQHNVYVKERFFNKDKVRHEYQFKTNKKESQYAFKDTIDFLTEFQDK